ncbi:MAG: hypothetical protein ACJA0Z_001763, partial [Halioglobus sp.]
MVEGPNARYISNRIFEDSAQNLFSETGVIQWAYNWCQFVDHTIGLRELGSEAINITFDPADILDFVELRDAEGQQLELGSDAEAVVGIRRTTLAARLKALCGDIDTIDALVGMVSEPQLTGSSLGELQHAIWRQQFEALRDGDRYFFAWNKSLKKSKRVLLSLLDLDWRKTLADV